MGGEPREQVALGELATELPHPAELLLGLHPLGHHTGTQSAGHLGDRGDDGGVAAVAAQLGHERAVDLEEREREALHVAERRVAGPEVVEPEPHPSSSSACSVWAAAAVSST